MLAWGLLPFGAFACWMWWRQGRPGVLGGPMAFEKALWLAYAIYAFLVLPLALALDPRLSPPLRLAFQLVAGWWWLRAVAELVLMYGFKAWKPPYGVGHNLLCMGLLVGAGSLAGAQLLPGQGPGAWLAPPWTGGDLHAWHYLWGMVLLLALESSYAVLFFLAREGDTAEVWYAHWGEPRFHRVMWWTRLNQLWALPLIAWTAWAMR